MPIFVRKIKVLLALCWIFSLSSCSERFEPKSGVRTFVDKNHYIDGWSPSKIKLSCDESQCPEGVGVLVWARSVGDVEKQEYEVSRCVAFVIGQSEILSNGHCDEVEALNTSTYFVYLKGGKQQAVPVVKSLDKKFQGDGEVSFDYSRLQLGQKLTGIHLLTTKKIDLRNAKTPISLETMVVNEAGSDPFELHMQRKECWTEADGWHFPILKNAHPDVMPLYGCSLLMGNSGSPVFEKGNSNNVVALVQSTSIDEQVENHLKRKLTRYFYGEFAMASVLYCVSSNSNCFQMSTSKFYENQMTFVGERVSEEVLRNFEENLTIFYSNSPGEVIYNYSGKGVRKRIPGGFLFSIGPKFLCRLPGETEGTPQKFYKIELRVQLEVPSEMEFEVEIKSLNSRELQVQSGYSSYRGLEVCQKSMSKEELKTQLVEGQRLAIEKGQTFSEAH